MVAEPKSCMLSALGTRVLTPEIRKHVAPATTIYTDEWSAYGKLAIWSYIHHTVNHSQAQYVNGRIYTQNIENVWSKIKPAIKGVYTHVSPQHLQSYLNEYSFRYSNRQYTKQMFDLILMNVAR